MGKSTNVPGLAKAAKPLKVPTILTTMAEKSFSGPIFPQMAYRPYGNEAARHAGEGGVVDVGDGCGGASPPSSPKSPCDLEEITIVDVHVVRFQWTCEKKEHEILRGHLNEKQWKGKHHAELSQALHAAG